MSESAGEESISEGGSRRRHRRSSSGVFTKLGEVELGLVESINKVTGKDILVTLGSMCVG